MRDMIKNEDILDKVGVVFVVDKMRITELRWFKHVNRRCTVALAGERVWAVGYGWAKEK